MLNDRSPLKPVPPLKGHVAWLHLRPRRLSEIAPVLGLDFHSHLLPGVDDGMVSFADSSAAISELKALGFDGAVLTPHIRKGLYDNSSQGLLRRFVELQDYLRVAQNNFKLHLAAEYYTDEHFLELIQAGDLLALDLGGERFTLVEFDAFQESPALKVCMSALVARGYRPIIAHVERYEFVAKHRDKWLDYFRGCNAVLQCDLGALVGQHGHAAKQFALWLKEHSQVGLWGTDLHRTRQIDRYIKPSLSALVPDGRLNKLLEPLQIEAS